MEVDKILIWHQGALGDLLLAGPALMAISQHYFKARITALGHPERWGLMAESLPLDEVWDSGEARWASLFGAEVLPPRIKELLSRFQLALLFGPRPQAGLQQRLIQAGIPVAHWLPSFPETGEKAVAALQARHLAALGLHYTPAPFKLVMRANQADQPVELSSSGPWLAVAPGSGQVRKNWPLSHYYEVSRALAWKFGLQMVWFAGPAEERLLPYLEALAQAQGHLLLANHPLAKIARVLSRCRLYLGNDSGLTHLAAAVEGPDILALFGPTDPRVWGPLGSRVHIMTAPCPEAPCAAGRNIMCAEPDCMKALMPGTVISTAARILSAQDEQVGSGL